jgi:hypothetical protein
MPVVVIGHSTVSERPALPPPEPKRRHRIRTSTTADGYGAATCTCGWTITTDSYAHRQHAINHHQAGTIGHLD